MKWLRMFGFWLEHRIQDLIEYPEVTAMRRRLAREGKELVDERSWHERRRV